MPWLRSATLFREKPLIIAALRLVDASAQSFGLDLRPGNHRAPTLLLRLNERVEFRTAVANSERSFLGQFVFDQGAARGLDGLCLQLREMSGLPFPGR